MERERRTSTRIKITLPAQIKLFSEQNELVGTAKAELMDLSQSGARILSEPIAQDPGVAHLEICIDLPPCYSVDPENAVPIEISSCLRWQRAKSHKTHIECGIEFVKGTSSRQEVLEKIVSSEQERLIREKEFCAIEKPKFTIARQMHSCNMYAVDLTIGCEHNCIYCHFSQHNKEAFQKKYPHFDNFPVPVDMSPLYEMKTFPKSVVYLSPSSDPFAPAARELTHELLSYLLPKGVIFTISTKGIIPDKTIALMKKYAHLIEDIAIGITNLDKMRNNILEPGCPSAEERLAHIEKLLSIGCVIFGRMDPIFPFIDDNEDALRKMIEIFYQKGIRHITGTYVFSYGKVLREMKNSIYLKDAVKRLTEKTYPIGGKAWSVSVEEKKQVYNFLHTICKKYGMIFHTCGCKETRLRNEGYSLICRELSYYYKQAEGPTK